LRSLGGDAAPTANFDNGVSSGEKADLKIGLFAENDHEPPAQKAKILQNCDISRIL
jgi:hypothetical protein